MLRTPIRMSTFVGGHVDHVDPKLKLAPKRNAWTISGHSLYIYYFSIASNKSWSTLSTCPQTRMDTRCDVDTSDVHTWSTHGPHGQDT